MTVVDAPAAVALEKPRAGVTRDRYIDSLRAIALVRVIVYHIFGWAWLTVVFPSIPIMFALAGSLVAASLDRSPMNPWVVLRRRIWRLLPPLWMLAAVAVPLMLFHGWTVDLDNEVGDELTWNTALFWILPISDPPGSVWGQDWTVALWYIRAYLWFLVMSPPLLWLFRRWPVRTMVIPLVGLVLATTNVFDLAGRVGEMVGVSMTYATCWMLGFAHHDNKIRPIALRKIIPVALALMAVGLWYALTHQGVEYGYDMDEIPLALALYGTGAVLLLLRLYPDFSWMAKLPFLDKLISTINARAMTIYLWNNPAIFLAGPLAGLWSVTRDWDDGGWHGVALQVGLTVLLIIASVLLFGWVEDVAARRKIKINPWPRTKRPGAHRLVLRLGIASGLAGLLFALVGCAAPAAPATTPATAPATTGAAQASNPLPERLVAGYWQGWGEPAIRLGDVPDTYNVVLLAFAIGDETGSLSFSQSVQSEDSLIADIKTLRSQGREVVLSVGGAEDGGLRVDNPEQRAALIKSAMVIIDRYGVSGLDWDLEHGFSAGEVAQASRELKVRYGPDFVLTMAPLLGQPHTADYRDLAARMGDDLNLVMPQYYNGGESDPDWIVARSLEWADIVGERRVAPGFMTTQTKTDTGVVTPGAACTVWTKLLTQAPDAPGLMTWSINLDNKMDYAFSRNCGQDVLEPS